jgi:hypothetical protein
MAIDDPEVIIGVAALVAAIAALIFAIIQTGAALAQYVQVSNRCSPRVTGVFNLTAGFWFQVSSLSWNPQYRMPVLTMPGLRGAQVAMEADPAWADFVPGRNFKLYGYVDYGRFRVSKTNDDDDELKEPRRIDVLPTAIFSVFAAIWTPIGTVLSAVALLLCFPLAFSCECVCGGGCGGRRKHTTPSSIARSVVGDLTRPLTFAWKLAIRYKTDGGAVAGLSSAPGLESAAWCQFLVNFQDAWWGYADIRWEWRLATMIPLDVYGATMETTMADLRLLAAMGGMCASTDATVLARTRCGEMLMHSQHLVLGRMAYYRSGRENIRPRITGKVPTCTSRFQHCIMAVQNHLKKRAATTGMTSLNNSNASREAIATLLSRPRTEFDAQIDCSLGNHMWLFSTATFKVFSNGLSAPNLDWSTEEARIFLGPLGQGIGGCSCLACCREWMAGDWAPSGTMIPPKFPPTMEPTPDFWPALALQAEQETVAQPDSEGKTTKGRARIVGPVISCLRVDKEGTEKLKGSYLKSVKVETLRACRGSCADLTNCACGRIARVVRPREDAATAPSTDETFAAAAINTKWLGKCSAELLGQAADSLAAWVSEPDQEKPELRQEVAGSLAAAWGRPNVNTGLGDAPAQPADSVKGNTLKADVNLVRVVMAATEDYLFAVRKVIGASNMWDGPVTEGFDDFGPVVLGA